MIQLLCALWRLVWVLIPRRYKTVGTTNHWVEVAKIFDLERNLLIIR